MTVNAPTEVGLADEVRDGLHVGFHVRGTVLTFAGEVQFFLISQLYASVLCPLVVVFGLGHTGSQEFSSVVPPQILGQVLRSAVHQDADQLVYNASTAIEDEHVHLVPSSICSGSKPSGKE